MRIGLVCPYSLTVPGGVQAQVLGLARNLRGLGVDARVLAPCDGPPPDAGVTPLGESVPTASNGSLAPLAPDPAAQLRTIRALRDEGFDVLHVHEPLAPGPTMTALLFRNAPMVGTFHRAGDSAAYTFTRPGVRWLAKRLDIRCAVSKDARRTAERALGGRYELLFNGIEVERFRKATPTPAPGRTIFFLGRHEDRKGLAVLLGALRHLPADVTVWVGGTGPQTEGLRARHGGDPRIEWLGRLSDDEVAARMRGTDVFCAPSLHGESFGVVLLEAMAAGAVVVASALDGYTNVATHQVDALLVPPGDGEALAAALRSALDDGGLRTRLVGAAEQRAQEFSMERLAEAYVERYERLARSGRRGSGRAAT
ncbi:MAG TPA: glycosyltransferase family 4 protein [Acidimicrobiales bacterium]|nr:glycosyltransferase family 4 protein [Acidimicrobiales bacterium]